MKPEIRHQVFIFSGLQIVPVHVIEVITSSILIFYEEVCLI